jgi:lipopolysaccharide transport system permease protein
MRSDQVIVSEAGGTRRLLDWSELRDYRDLSYFLVWRDIKGRYAQSVMGIGWAVVQPVVTMLVFTVVFGNLARVSSDGVPYAIFSFTALVPWTFFSNALTTASLSLVSNAEMLRKIYFPRIILPFAAILGKLVDLAIAMVLLFALMVPFGFAPKSTALILPFLIVITMLTAMGLGAFSGALAIQYRDIKHAQAFGIQLFMYAAPVVYPTSLVPEAYRLLYAVNPMVGVIEGFRSALLQTQPMPWDLIAVGTVSAFVVATGGILYFRRMEKYFADVA